MTSKMKGLSQEPISADFAVSRQRSFNDSRHAEIDSRRSTFSACSAQASSPAPVIRGMRSNAMSCQ